MRTTLGCLKRGEKFLYEGRTYKAGSLINGTNGYVACVNVETHKVTRLYIDTTVEKEGDSVEK